MYSNIRVLLIEDNLEDVRLIVEMLLNKKGQFSLTHVASLTEGLALMRSKDVDVVLLDLGLPERAGLDALRLANPSAHTFPIIVLSGLDDESAGEIAVREGAQDYLIKRKVDTELLCRSIRFALERKRSQIAFETSEKKCRLLHETMRDAFGAVDMQGRIIDCNKAYADMLGYPPEELRRLTYLDLTPEKWHSFEAKIVNEQILSRGYSDVYEKEYRKKDGTLFPVELRTFLIKDESGNPASIWAIVRDVTEKKNIQQKLEKALEESFSTTTYLNSIINCIADPIFVKDRQHRWVFLNNAYCRLKGRSRDELLGKSIYDIDPKNEADVMWQDDEIVFNTGAEHVREGERTDFEGIVRITVTKKTLYKNEKGEDFIVGVAQDITASKQAEAERDKLEAQLLQSQKMEAIGQLAGGVAHDFNNILCAITGFGSLLNLQLEGNDKGTQFVSEILHAADRAAALTQSLLAFSRKQHSNPQPMDLNATIQKTEKILAITIGEDIHLSLKLTEGNTSVCADSNQIAQILINLAANARDAMPKGGALTIRTAHTFIDEAFMKIHGFGSSGEYVVMTVEDSGLGMDAATRKRVFEPFFTTKEVGKGTGLGLSMVYGIVKQHNGFIDAYSEMGTGTAFKVYLPALETRAEAQEINGRFEPEGATETILVVEDDSMVRRSLIQMLQSVGHMVIEAYDGDDAVTKFVEHKDEIHLVLMDVIMPRKNGGDAYRELKAIQPDVKIILMSGYAGDYLSGKLSMEEDVHFISKPVNPKELFEKIRSVLSGGY